MGLRRALNPGRGVPILVGVYGVGMIGGGLFPPDPALGWPAGAPEGLPEQLSTTSMLHTACAAAAFLSLIVASLVSGRLGGRTWAAYSAGTGLVTFVITTLPWGAGSESLRFAAGAVLISGWLAAVSLRLRSDIA